MTESPTPLRPKSIVVIQTAFVGDIVLTTSFLAGLRTLAPNAKIHFLTTPAGVKLLEPNPWGIVLHAYDKRGRESGPAGFLRKARELRDLRPELVFCLHRSLRSTLLAKISGGFVIGFREGVGSVLFDKRASRSGHTFEAEKNLALLEAWAGPVARSALPFPALDYSPTDRVVADELLAGLAGEKFVAMAPSSVWATKRWPVEKFADLALFLWEKHRLRTVIVGGTEAADLELGEKLRELVAGKLRAGDPQPLNLSGRTSLGSLKAVLARPELVIANDSAPLHIAIALGRKVVGVFGPTTKALGFFPLAPKGMADAVEVNGLSCRPCGLHGHHTCPQGHFRCMLELRPEAVLSAA
ncbi:MAG: glycosyltransferase family 9 protein, partial [Bdellovibrionota bacterium]